MSISKVAEVSLSLKSRATFTKVEKYSWIGAGQA